MGGSRTPLEDETTERKWSHVTKKDWGLGALARGDQRESGAQPIEARRAKGERARCRAGNVEHQANEKGIKLRR